MFRKENMMNAKEIETIERIQNVKIPSSYTILFLVLKYVYRIDDDNLFQPLGRNLKTKSVTRFTQEIQSKNEMYLVILISFDSISSS